MDKQSNLKVWPVRFPKCLLTVSGPSIVPCHNMGQSHHHLRLPINVGSRPHLRNSWENSADAMLVVAERGGPYFIWKGVDTLDFWLNNRLGNHFRWDLLWSIGSCQWDCCCSHTWLYIYPKMVINNFQPFPFSLLWKWRTQILMDLKWQVWHVPHFCTNIYK